MALRDKSKDIQCGIYYLECRPVKHLTTHGQKPWVPVNVQKLFLRENRTAHARFYFPWQAEEEARIVRDPQRGCPTVFDAGAYDLRVRCEKPAENVPMREFSATVAYPLSIERRQDVSTDGSLYTWEAQPDPEGTRELVPAGVDPVLGCRDLSAQEHVEEPVLLDESPEPEPVRKKAKAKKKASKKKPSKPEGAAF